MTDQLTVTLDDLKRAVSRLEDGKIRTVSRDALRAEAWRTAFEWREGWYAKVLAVMHRASGDISIIEEGAEGMRLIREKLR